MPLFLKTTPLIHSYDTIILNSHLKNEVYALLIRVDSKFELTLGLSKTEVSLSKFLRTNKVGTKMGEIS